MSSSCPAPFGPGKGTQTQPHDAAEMPLTCRNHRFKVKQDGVTRSAADMLAYQGVTLDQLEAVMKKNGVVPGALWCGVQRAGYSRDGRTDAGHCMGVLFL